MLATRSRRTGAEGAKNALDVLFAPRPGKTILHGKVSGAQEARLDRAGRTAADQGHRQATGATINDVLLAALTNALRKYLVAKTP